MNNQEFLEYKMQQAKELKQILEGCMALIECDTVISERVDQLSARIDIVNKRLRKIETALTKGVIICDNDLGDKRAN